MRGSSPRAGGCGLNYNFLNLPWLTMDPGVKLGDPGTSSSSTGTRR